MKNKYELDFLLVTNKRKVDSNLTLEIKIKKYKPSTNKNKIIEKIKNSLKLIWYQIINYQMYDESYCYQECDKLKNNLGTISSFYYNIYVDKTNKKKEELIANLVTDNIRHIIFKTEKDQEEFLKNNSKLTEKCLIIDSLYWK